MKMMFPQRRKALALALLPMALPLNVMAQEQEKTGLEEVVVTGSLIRGTPEDAALPVEVFNAAELQELGDPSPLEFVKSLTISGPTTGEAYYFSGSNLTNNVQFNLRGIGSDKTLTLFNGRRAFQNSVVYPSGAIERMEILKDGAAVTYGADATGGVVNVITKTNFDGFEGAASYKTYDGSEEGEWKVGATAGFDTEFANLLFSVEWDHRSELHSYDRDFAFNHYGVNPAPSSPLTNVAAYLPRGTLPAVPTNAANGAGEFGGPLASYQYDFTQSSCESVGGSYVPTAAGAAAAGAPAGSGSQYPWAYCAYNYIGYYNLVEENDVHRVYAQLTSKVSENSDFTLRALWARNYSPHQYGSPAQPVTRGPARNTGATFQLYVPSVNPYAAEFAQRSGWANQTVTVPGVGTFPALALTRGYTPALYRAFAHGGNDTFASGDNHSTPNSNETKYWHITASLDGAITDSISYNVGATFNQFKSVNSQPDVLGYRLQEAMNGFGGPNCNAVDMNPARYGTQAVAAGVADTGVRPAGCMWWNPFASNFPSNPFYGSNPSFVAGGQNPDELVNWVFNKREAEDNHYDFTFDAVFSGELPLELPGGAIAWGLGGQYRTQKNRETVNDPLFNGQTPCDWPGQDPRATTDPAFDGCTLDLAGPYLFFANNFPDATEQQQQSYFAELNFPILESLNVSVAGRYEEFEPIGLDATVYKVSAKWQIIDQFALRGSYGTNYQAPGPDIIPGELTNTVASYTRAGSSWLGSTVFTRSDIEPETATVWNAGAILQLDWGTDQEFQFILDYFDIETEDELGLVATSNDIANAVFTPSGTTSYANCSHPLASRVTFNGDCRDSTTDPGNPAVWTTGGGFASVRTDFGNGPGQHVAGFDLQLNYSIGVGPGRLTLGTNITKYTDNETTDTILDGVVVKGADDRLGYLNFATVGASQPELRGNFFTNYSFGDHNVRLQVNYVSGVDDERYLNEDGSLNTTDLRPRGFQPGTTTAFDISTFGVYGDDWISTDLHYLWRASWATLGLSVLNVADEDPPASRQEFSFDPRIGNALGRQFELSLRKSF